MPVLDHRELVDREPVVLIRVVEVEHANLSAANAAFLDILHRHPGDEHPVEVAVAGLQSGSGWLGQLALSVFERIVGKVGIQAHQRGPQAAVQNDLAIVSAFRSR